MLGHSALQQRGHSGSAKTLVVRRCAIGRVSTPSRPRKAVTAHAALDTTGGSGTFDGGVGGRGGGGDSGSNEGEGDDRRPSRRGIGWKGWEERVAADPRFPFKVFLEQVIGVGAAVVGDMMSRPNWGMNELDFVFSTLVVGSIMNFSLMYLLAPTLASAAGGASQGLIAKLLSEQTLKSRGIPGGHMFEPGAYGIGARGLNVLYKGLMFGVIGTLAGIVGTSMSNGLLILRKKFDPDFKLQNETPNILKNAAAWGLHMGVSSNLRYQAINGIEMVIQHRLPLPVFAVLSAMYRTANNLLGGVSFVAVAKLIGAQKAAAPAEVVATSVAQAKDAEKRKLKHA